MEPYVYALLLLAGVAGGFIDAVAGGGGLITVPALLATGMPPQVALGTNKLQSSFGTSMAVWRYARAGLMKTPGLKLAVVLSFLASVGGAHAVSVLSKALLKQLHGCLGGIGRDLDVPLRGGDRRMTREKLDRLRRNATVGQP